MHHLRDHNPDRRRRGQHRDHLAGRRIHSTQHLDDVIYYRSGALARRKVGDGLP
jgi:hypothetical protein